jgi:hypothetical protein
MRCSEYLGSRECRSVSAAMQPFPQESTGRIPEGFRRSRSRWQPGKTSASQLQSLSSPISTWFCCSIGQTSSRAWWLVDELNQVCLSRATIKMCTSTGGTELGSSGLDQSLLSQWASLNTGVIGLVWMDVLLVTWSEERALWPLVNFWKWWRRIFSYMSLCVNTCVFCLFFPNIR